MSDKKRRDDIFEEIMQNYDTVWDNPTNTDAQHAIVVAEAAVKYAADWILRLEKEVAYFKANYSDLHARINEKVPALSARIDELERENEAQKLRLEAYECLQASSKERLDAMERENAELCKGRDAHIIGMSKAGMLTPEQSHHLHDFKRIAENERLRVEFERICDRHQNASADALIEAAELDRMHDAINNNGDNNE